MNRHPQYFGENMRIRIAVPMNHYLRCEVIYNTSKTDLSAEYTQMFKVLSSDIVMIYEPLISNTLIKIIDKVKCAFPIPTTFRLWESHNFYIEETVIE